MSVKDILGIICGIIAVFLIALPSLRRVQRMRNPKDVESHPADIETRLTEVESCLAGVESCLVRIETNIAWLIRIAGIQFAFLSALAFTG